MLLEEWGQSLSHLFQAGREYLANASKWKEFEDNVEHAQFQSTIEQFGKLVQVLRDGGLPSELYDLSIVDERDSNNSRKLGVAEALKKLQGKPLEECAQTLGVWFVVTVCRRVLSKAFFVKTENDAQSQALAEARKLAEALERSLHVKHFNRVEERFNFEVILPREMLVEPHPMQPIAVMNEVMRRGCEACEALTRPACGRCIAQREKLIEELNPKPVALPKSKEKKEKKQKESVIEKLKKKTKEKSKQ